MRFRALVLSSMQRLIAPEHYEDAYQDGCLAVLEAIRCFDASLGIYFSKYVQLKVNYCFLERGRFYKGPAPETPLSLDAALSDAPDAGTLADGIADDAPQADDTLIHREAADQLRHLVRALPDQYRLVIVAHYFEGLSLAEIARQRGLSPNTVSTWHRRGLHALRKAFNSPHFV
nr:sigma-70 family RNA polymerase sigma factor [Eubacterium sp. 1001713B170207_170306_E7]